MYVKYSHVSGRWKEVIMKQSENMENMVSAMIGDVISKKYHELLEKDSHDAMQ